MIDIRKLKELVRLMVNNDLTELDLRDSEEQVTLRRQHHSVPGQLIAPAPTLAPVAVPTTTPTAPADTEAALDNLHKIESPMVGTFYSASDPDSPAFVKVGDHVDPDTVVCLIEAMKIFNEIKADCSGTIEKILIKNAESVEFGQPLFAVKLD